MFIVQLRVGELDPHDLAGAGGGAGTILFFLQEIFFFSGALFPEHFFSGTPEKFSFFSSGAL